MESGSRKTIHKAHERAELLVGVLKARVMYYKCAECAQTLNALVFAKINKTCLFLRYAESQSDSYSASIRRSR